MNDKAMQIAMILDRSGSMSSIEGATVEGMNAFIHEQQKPAADVSLLLVQFDDSYEQVYSGPIEQAPMFTLAEHPGANQVRFQPRGSTALLDAIGKTIDDLGRAFSILPEAQRPGKVIVVIMTDGQENHSSVYNSKQIAERIKRQREVYKWEFQFLAANQDAISTASTMNIPMQNSITYAASPVGARSVMASASRNVKLYQGALDGAPAAAFTQADRDAAMETESDETRQRI